MQDFCNHEAVAEWAVGVGAVLRGEICEWHTAPPSAASLVTKTEGSLRACYSSPVGGTSRCRELCSRCEVSMELSASLFTATRCRVRPPVEDRDFRPFPGPIGPGLCRILHVDFRERTLRNCPKSDLSNASSMNLVGIRRTKWAAKALFGACRATPQAGYAAGTSETFSDSFFETVW
jgi:hypothetical protein